MESKKIKILVAAHKADPAIRKDEIYVPIHVGKALSPNMELGFQGDDTGENISEKNPAYCELTAVYWAWKNLKDVDYIGLAHYRRYLNINSTQILTILNKVDYILPNPIVLKHSVFEELVMLTSYEEVYLMFDALISFNPKFEPAIKEYFFSNNKFTVCNMFITISVNFDKYCKFIFTVLGNIEEREKWSGFTRQRRVLGYLAEALLGFWIYVNKYSVEYVRIDEIIEKREKSKLASMMPKWVFNLKNNLIFRLASFNIKKPYIFEEWILRGLYQDGVEIKNS